MLGARIGGPLWLLHTALALHRLGRFEEASAALDAGAAWIEKTGECWCERDIERARRELAEDVEAGRLRRA